MNLENLKPRRYNYWMGVQKELYDARMSGKYSSLPKSQRIEAVLKDYPQATVWDIGSVTNLYPKTILEWHEKRGREVNYVPGYQCEEILHTFFMFGITTSDLRKKEWWEIKKRTKTGYFISDSSVDEALEYVNDFWDKRKKEGNDGA